MASRFVLDLRKPAPPPVESDADRCQALQLEVAELKQTQRILLSQLQSTTTPPASSTQPQPQLLQRELAETKAQLAKLTEDHDHALKLIVQLSAQLASSSSSSSSSAVAVARTTTTTTKQQPSAALKSPVKKPRDRIADYYRALDLPSHTIQNTNHNNNYHNNNA